MSIPYSNAGRTVNIHKIKGMNYHELKTNELCTKNADGVMEGVNVFATSGNLTTTGTISGDIKTDKIEVANGSGKIQMNSFLSIESDQATIAVTRPGGGGFVTLNDSTTSNSWQISGPKSIPGGDPIGTDYTDDGLAISYFDHNQGVGTRIAHFREHNGKGDMKLTGELRVDTISGKSLGANSQVEINDKLSVTGAISGGDTTVTSLSTAIPGTYGYGPITGGDTTVTSLTQTVPYHLVLGLNPNSGGIFKSTHGVSTDLNTLFVRAGESPTAIYNNNLVSSTYWRPSITGVFQININCTFRSVNEDYLVEDIINFKKLISGTYQTILSSNNRRYGTTVNEADARVFTNHNTISQTIYAEPSDSFKFAVYGKAFYGNDIWVLVSEYQFKASITKVA